MPNCSMAVRMHPRDLTINSYDAHFSSIWRRPKYHPFEPGSRLSCSDHRNIPSFFQPHLLRLKNKKYSPLQRLSVPKRKLSFLTRKMQVCIARLTSFINDFLDLLWWEVLATGIDTFSYNFFFLIRIFAQAFPSLAELPHLDSATELALRESNGRFDTRNSRSGSVGWSWSTIGAGAVGFSTVGWEASSIKGNSSTSPSFGWVGTVVEGCPAVGVSAATTFAPAKIHRAPKQLLRATCESHNVLIWFHQDLLIVIVIVFLNLPRYLNKFNEASLFFN